MSSVNLFNSSTQVGIQGLKPLVLSREDVSVHLEIVQSNEATVVARARVTNHSPGPAKVRGIRWCVPMGADNTPALRLPVGSSPEVFATESFRGDYFGVGSTRGQVFASPLDNRSTEFGWSQDWVFPALYFGSPHGVGGVLVAGATQNRFHPIFRLRGSNGNGAWLFEIDELAMGGEGLVLQPGEELQGEDLFFHLSEARTPQEALSGYYEYLRSNCRFARRSHNPLVKQRIWCSWNYDFFHRITAADVLRQLPVLRTDFPTVGFAQLDDGYQKLLPGGERAMIDFLYEDSQGHNEEKFPGGMKALASAIREGGLRPAIWMALWAAGNSKMTADHPDWVLRDECNQRLAVPMVYGEVCILDPSHPGVRAYLEHVCQTVFGDWGYEGVKLDFSNFAFENKTVRYYDSSRTAIEWRRELVVTFRRHLPADGFFGWCVVAGTANPFLGAEGADYFRCAEDIGEGNWPLVKRLAGWMANTNMFLQERPVLPNIDSIGWSSHFSETEWQSWLNLATISGAALEISGDLTTLNADRRQKLRFALENCDPERRVRCLDLDASDAAHPPVWWLAQGKTDALVGVFNWENEPQTFELGARGLAGAVFLTDNASAGSHLHLGARQSVLLRVWRSGP